MMRKEKKKEVYNLSNVEEKKKKGDCMRLKKKWMMIRERRFRLIPDDIG